MKNIATGTPLAAVMIFAAVMVVSPGNSVIASATDKDYRQAPTFAPASRRSLICSNTSE
jgi:hypothetical protein